METFYSVPESAKKLKISVGTTWRWIREKRIVSMKIAGRTVIPASALACAPKPKNVGRRVAKPAKRRARRATSR